MKQNTFSVSLDSSANSLALNSDSTQVVIAGSHIFKIFLIEENEFVEKTNLYAPKTIQPNFSSNDVAWSAVDENKIATVATNGGVVIWNLQKSSRSKLDISYKDDDQPVSKVNFHPTEPHLLISGSRAGAVKLFDLREKEAVAQFCKNPDNPDPIRDVQFSPYRSSLFAAGIESGNIQLWDIRRTDKAEHFFAGHRDSVLALDWHPHNRHYFASASRDRTIKIWDFSENSVLHEVIKTAASVARVKWKPDNANYIGSCPLTIGSISVWDIRRPYIPYATLNEHSNITSGIVWQNHTSNLISVGKDNTLYYHVFDEATHPIEKINPLGLAVSPHFGIASAKPHTNQSMSVTCGIPLPNNNVTRSNANFEPVISDFSVFQFDDQEKLWGSDVLIKLADEYRLKGKSLKEMCEHNAGVAQKLNRMQEAVTWEVLQIIYGNFSCSQPGYHHPQVNHKTHRKLDNMLKLHSRNLSGEKGDTSASQQEPDTEPEDPPDTAKRLGKGMNYPPTNFFFCEDDLSQLTFEDEAGGTATAADVAWQLPNEAIRTRKDIVYRSTTPPPSDEFISSQGPAKDAGSGTQDLNVEESANLKSPKIDDGNPLRIVDVKKSESVPDLSHVVKDMLYYYAEKGDVQMAVTVIIVLGDCIEGLVDEITLEHWFLSYIEILHQLRMWNKATEIIQSSFSIPYVSQMNLNSTSPRLSCGTCRCVISQAQRIRKHSYCRKCKSSPPQCAVCRVIVHGMYVWCQGCSHGGHIAHMKEWFTENRTCPTGCGHLCEYT